MSATIELTGIGKNFPGVVALQDVDLALQPGRVHALLGENGAGKSTLINILGGSLTADHGHIRMEGRIVRFVDAHDARRLGIVSVHQEVDLFPDLSVTENIALEQGLPARRWGWIDRREQRRRARQALAVMHANLSPHVLASRLSPAQRQLLILAAALSESPRVLILDEPTSSLSAAETEVLFEQVRRLRDGGTAVLYVSHRFEEFFALADEATVLRDGRRVWTGMLSETTPEQLIHHMVGRDLDTRPRDAVTSCGPVRFRCRNLSAEDGAFRDISLEVHAGEILGLYGLIGAGRSEWAQGVLGLHPLAHGEIWLNDRMVVPAGPGPMARLGLAYVPEDRLRQGLCRGLSIRTNLVLAVLRQLAVGGWLTRRPEISRTRAAVRALSVRLRSIEQAIGTLSGGNQQKVVVGRWLERQPNVLILDEPTRGIDVAAKAEIHGLIRRLAAEGRAIVLISSDLPEVLAQSDRVGVFREGRLVGLFDPRRHSANEIAAAALPDESEDGAKSQQPAASARESLAGAAGWWRALPLREGGLLVLLLVLLGTQLWRSGQTATAGHLPSLATDAALLSCCALGAAIVLLVGGIDISLGSLMALSAGVAGQMWQEEYPLALVFAVGILVGGLGGLVNALVSLVGRVHPIVVTLGTLSLYRGLALWRLKQDVQIPGGARNFLVEPRAGLPLLVWLGLALAFCIGLFLRRSVLGRQMYAVGSNPAAATRAGISRSRTWLAAFTLQGMLAGLAGLLYLARSGQLQAVSYEDTTLQAIAAAVVGGVAITGGRGTVLGVVLGCLFLVALPPACEFLHIPTIWQRTLVGAVLVVAVTLDALWRRRQT
jgi:ABC-type sugar transport system ATPase subunit/ribose/xylose/arabinose/galactoside ABC-type transport system permease subunit